MHVFVLYVLLLVFSILVYMLYLYSYSAFRLQECSIKSVSQRSTMLSTYSVWTQSGQRRRKLSAERQLLLLMSSSSSNDATNCTFTFSSLLVGATPCRKKSSLYHPTTNDNFNNKKHLKNVGPISCCEPFYIVIHQVSLLPPLSHAACASMSRTTTTTTTTTRDRGDRYGPMEWAQHQYLSFKTLKFMKTFNHSNTADL